MYKHCLNMEKAIQVRAWGNSAGVLLPKEWIGKEVKVILIDRSLEIKKEVFDILSPYLEDIIGIYLVGSYARGEYESDSDIDIIAISNNTKKEIISSKYHVSIYPFESIKKTIKKSPLLIMPRLFEAKSILNSALLKELNSVKINKFQFNDFIEESKRIISINRNLENLDSKYADAEVVYSIILRLRAFYLIKCFLAKKSYQNKDFQKWVKKNAKISEFDKAYSIYRSIKEKVKPNAKISVSSAITLLEFLEKEAESYDK